GARSKPSASREACVAASGAILVDVGDGSPPIEAEEEHRSSQGEMRDEGNSTTTSDAQQVLASLLSAHHRAEETLVAIADRLFEAQLERMMVTTAGVEMR
ncbi:unnamed protein product, partial [Amoebophrya sp. A25]